MTPSIAVVPRWDAGAAGKLRASMMLLMRIDRWDVRRDVVFVPRGAVRRVEVIGSSAAHCLEAIYLGDSASDAV